MPLALASHWLADFCKYHIEYVEINYYYNAAFSKCDRHPQQANQLLSLATKGQPLPSLETVPFFKEVDGLCRLPIGVLCSQRKLAPLSHMYSTTSTPTSNIKADSILALQILGSFYTDILLLTQYSRTLVLLNFALIFNFYLCFACNTHTYIPLYFTIYNLLYAIYYFVCFALPQFLFSIFNF